MEIVYYPDMFIDSEDALKALLLFWGSVKTVVPPSQMEYINAYLRGDIKHEVHYPLEKYKKICDIAGSSIIDFLIISDQERETARDRMFNLITGWNKDTGFYDSLKIRSIDDLVGKWVEWYWFLHEKLEWPLIELMLEEQLVVNWSPGEIVGYKEIGKAYQSIIADELKNSRDIRIITEDEFSLAAKSGVMQERLQSEQRPEEGYQLVSIAIPNVFVKPDLLRKLSWKKVLKIRQDLLPFSEKYYKEIEGYQQEINTLSSENRDDEAFGKFCEFCKRVSVSFRPLSKETGKILRITSNPKAIGFLNGIILPSVKLLVPNAMLSKVCDVMAISSTAGVYVLSHRQPLAGFEYLENLNRALRIEELKDLITCLMPKALRNKC